MKKIIGFLVALIIVFILLHLLNSYLLTDIHKSYFDKMGTITDYKKNEGIVMQEEAAKRSETLLLYGSSEVGVQYSLDPFYPSNFFNNKKDGFQVELVGRGYCQSLIHLMNFGALGVSLRKDKVVFIVSPQWFDRTGLTGKHLNVNFSEEQFYGFIYNKSISEKLKKEVCNRLVMIYRKENLSYEVRNLCNLIIKNNQINRFIKFIETPYYKARYFLLKLRDEVQTESLIRNSSKAYFKNEYSRRTHFNWNTEFNLFTNLSINNPFGVDNLIYNKKFKNNTQILRKYIADIFTTNGPEYGDFKMLLQTFKELGIHPLIVDLPLNGRWYDYCGYNAAKRKMYYNKVNVIVKSYGFQLFDMSNHEYDKHEFKDASHPELKGWALIDQAIDLYYHQNKN
jgi:D-alanine transfer protein